MTVITQRELIRTVAERWYSAYFPFQQNETTVNFAQRRRIALPDKENIYNKLHALDLHTATAEQINSIIGNSSWTDIKCTECKQPVISVLILSQDDGESSSFYLCVDCLNKAYTTLNELLLPSPGLCKPSTHHSMNLRDVKISCTCCEGTGLVFLSEVHLRTLQLLADLNRPAKPSEFTFSFDHDRRPTTRFTQHARIQYLLKHNLIVKHTDHPDTKHTWYSLAPRLLA